MAGGHVLDREFVFLGDENPPVVGSADGSLWRSYISGSGPPTVRTENGFMVLALEATLESQIAELYFGDELSLDIDKIQQVDFYVKLSTATLHASASVAFGLCSARNDDLDLLSAMACFRLLGNNNVLLETDDGTNDNDDVSAGQTLGTSIKRFTIDFASGLKTVVPPPSVGGKSNVLFSADDSRGNLQQVARGTRFDMGNYSSGLQLFARIQKRSASSVVAAGVADKLSIERIRVRYKSQ